MNKRQKEIQEIYLNNEEACLDALTETYEGALADINARIAELLGRDDADLQHVIYQVEYQQAMRSQVEAILDQLQTQNFESISQYLAQCYEDGFLGTMYDLQGQGIPLVFPIDQEQVVDAILHETNLSESLYESLDLTKLKRNISSEISRGISQGLMYGDISDNISRYAGISRNNAMRIARTEGHRIQCTASMNACERAKEKGADVVKQWDASLDGRTRDSHRQVDGEIRELDEKFSNGLMFPSDPSGRAEEVINCRCGLLQRARWAVGGEITKWAEDAPVLIDDNGTTQLVKIDEKNYNSFKEKYYEAVDRSVIEGISTSNGITVQSVSRHQFERMNERGITVGDVKNALTSPLHIGEIIIGDNGKPSQRFIGENVTVNINPETGNVVTTWKTGKRILNKYKGGE